MNNTKEQSKQTRLSNMASSQLSEYSYNLKKNTQNRIVQINQGIKENTNLFQKLIKKYGQNQNNIHGHK